MRPNQDGPVTVMFYEDRNPVLSQTQPVVTATPWLYVDVLL